VLHSRKSLLMVSLLILTLTATTYLIAGSNNKFVNNDLKSVPDYDTLSTTCLSLVVTGNGSYGREGVGLVNMDYVNDGDCDANADVYLYDGSPILGWIDGSDTIMHWSYMDAGNNDSIKFISDALIDNYIEGNFEVSRSIFTEIDSSIVLKKTFYASQLPEECNYIIHHLQVYSYDDQNHNGLMIGEVIDWDIPSDTVLRNGSDFDEDLMAIWQFGAYYDDTTSQPCDPLRNDSRFGGMAFLTMYTWDGINNSLVTDSEGRPFHNAYTVDNPTYVYGNDYGFEVGETVAIINIVHVYKADTFSTIVSDTSYYQ